MEHKVLGTTMPVLEVSLDHGERVIAESGQLSWLTGAIDMSTAMSGGGGRGLLGALARAASGATMFLTEYSASRGPGMVAFASRMPGTIMPVEIGAGQEYMVHSTGFLCATTGVQVGIGFQRSLGRGIFGGTGFILQRLSGQGTAFVELSGEVVTYSLGPGEALRVHPGHVGMFESAVTFDITTVPGIRNKLFGGDGLFLVELKGPGKVWLQSLPLPNLAHALMPYLPQSSGS